MQLHVYPYHVELRVEGRVGRPDTVADLLWDVTVAMGRTPPMHPTGELILPKAWFETLQPLEAAQAVLGDQDNSKLSPVAVQTMVYTPGGLSWRLTVDAQPSGWWRVVLHHVTSTQLTMEQRQAVTSAVLRCVEPGSVTLLDRSRRISVGDRAGFEENLPGTTFKVNEG